MSEAGLATLAGCFEQIALAVLINQERDAHDLMLMQGGHQRLPTQHPKWAAGLVYQTYVHAHDLAVAGHDGAATVAGEGAGIVEKPRTKDPAKAR